MYFIRHSEKLDFANGDEWLSSQRFTENMFDPPLSKNGQEIAEKYIKNFAKKINIDNIIDNIVLYSSPLTRCIQTCLIFQKYFFIKYKRHILINIEYGLTEIGHDMLGIDKLELKNEKFSKKKNVKIIDKHLMPSGIYKNFGKENFNISYKSLTNQNNYKDSILQQYNDSIIFFNNLPKHIDNQKVNIFVTSGALMNLLLMIQTKKMGNHLKDYLGWCVTINVSYNKKNNKYETLEITKGM
jgi:hypothetical protein